MNHIHASQRQELLALLDASEVPVADEAFLLDQRRRYHGVGVVVRPRSVASVQNIMRFCARERIEVVVQGGNTGLVGGSVVEGGVLINMGQLNAMEAVNENDNTITVQAGCVLQQVHEAAARAQRVFPLRLASEGSCQIGGNIATNAGGLNVLRYGTMRDLVLGVEVVLADGSVVSHLEPLHKNTTGYDWRQLLVGSEGTLGIITAATLKLFAAAHSQAHAWVGVPHIEAALTLLRGLRQRFAERLTSFELMSDVAVQLSADMLSVASPVSSPWHVLVRLEDSLPDVDLDNALVEMLAEAGWMNTALAQSPEQAHVFWRLREGISAAQRVRGVSIKHDIAVPIARMSDFIRHCTEALAACPVANEQVVFGHLGDGSLHYNVFIVGQPDASAYEHEDLINTVVYQKVVAHGGTIAAEHGIGRLKKSWLPWVRSAQELACMRAIKQHMDPLGLLNPRVLFGD